MANLPLLSPQDYTDAFLALYAIKSPEISPGYDPRPASLPELMRALVEGDMDAPGGPGGGRQPSVFFLPRPSFDLVRVILRIDPSPDLVRIPVPCAADGGAGEEGAGAGRVAALCPAGTD
jgi:hypothetical protein